MKVQLNTFIGSESRSEGWLWLGVDANLLVKDYNETNTQSMAALSWYVLFIYKSSRCRVAFNKSVTAYSNSHLAENESYTNICSVLRLWDFVIRTQQQLRSRLTENTVVAVALEKKVAFPLNCQLFVCVYTQIVHSVWTFLNKQKVSFWRLKRHHLHSVVFVNELSLVLPDWRFDLSTAFSAPV